MYYQTKMNKKLKTITILLQKILKKNIKPCWKGFFIELDNVSKIEKLNKITPICDVIYILLKK